MVPYLRAANVKDGVLDLSDVKQMNFTPAEQQVFSLRPGDVLVTEGSGSLGSVGASAVWRGELEGVVCFQNTLLRLRPREGITEGRFLEWWARSAFGSGVFASVATGANIYHISAERVRALPIALPRVDEQARIAAFLDAETARIDQLAMLRNKSLELLRERMQSRLDNAVRGGVRSGGKRAEYSPLGLIPSEWRQGRLRNVDCEVQTGPFGSQLHAEDYIEDGWPVINPANIRQQGLVADRSVTISDAVRERLSRHILRVGDVVFGRRGELGRAGIVADAQEGWICGTGSLRVRFEGEAFHAGYLRRYLAIPAVRHYFQLHSVGSTMANLNSSILLNMPLLLPDISEQQRISRDCDDIELHSQKRELLIARQLTLLSERRQALITAAVTGQFDVSTASGRGIED
ncbi:restriction endonuclease subunit S [Streptomyces dysideae]|uniref:restriction endonuclease subunit S n=1 Tax=Streptomyces dysideae TaxID=909626 RepID=UPI00131BF455|nr:restriction endonuclease subunit S [Streptomyces dysideae]